MRIDRGEERPELLAPVLLEHVHARAGGERVAIVGAAEQMQLRLRARQAVDGMAYEREPLVRRERAEHDDAQPTRGGRRAQCRGRLIEAVRDDARRVLTVSGLTRSVEWGKGSSVSLPRLVGKEGLMAELQPTITPDEQRALEESAAVVREAAASLEFQRA